MESFKKWLQTTGGKIIATILSVAAVALAVWVTVSAIAGGPQADANNKMYICSETLKSFRHEPAIGESVPVMSPYSGKETGYPAEPCYWTADGGTKKDPTWVLVNQSVGKSGPTFCPDCGRLVVGHNPEPQPGMKPPKTKDELLHTAAR